MKAVLFYWSKGADIRVRLIKKIKKHNDKNEPVYIAKLAEDFNMSHVAVRKHIELLLEYGFVKEINPDGKPHYLELTENGKKVAKEFEK